MRTRSCLVLALLVGCGGGDPGDETCALEATFSGARSISGVGSVACLTQFAGPDIDVVYAPLSGTIDTIELTIADVPMGETATGLAATVRVAEEGGASWSSDACTVDITEHTDHGPAELGQYYRAVGVATCPPLASEPDDGPALTVDSFELIVTPTWP
jgi:hypothetical protein